MAIQTLILGAPITGAGGDKYRDAHNKINANFVYINSRIAAVESSVDALESGVAAISADIGNVGSVLDAINGVTV